MAGNKPGPDTILDRGTLGKIRDCILAGHDFKKTAEVCEIDENTFYGWRSDNYLEFKTKTDGWKLEADINRRMKMLGQAERNLQDILDIGTTDKDELKVVADISKYISSTLGRQHFSTKVENEMSGGVEIKVSKEISDKYETTSNTVGNSEGQE